MAAFSNPLEWPAHWHRTPERSRQRARFSAALEDSLELMFDEVEKLNGEHAVLTGDFVMGKRGSILAVQPKDVDTAVALYFTRAGSRLCVPCDVWDELYANVRSVALTVKTIRDLERWGSKAIAAAAASGFKALAPGSPNKTPFELLELDQYATPDTIKAQYKRLARSAHPDAGGSTEKMAALTAAYEAALKEAESCRGLKVVV